MGNGDNNAPAIDFSKYTESGAPAIDFSKYTGGGAGPSSDRSSPAYWDALKDKYGLPHSVDLSKTYFQNLNSLPDEDAKKLDAMKFSRAYAEANPAPPTPTGFFSRMGDEARNIWRGMFGGPNSGPFDMPETQSVAGFTPPQNPLPAIQARAQEMKEHPAAGAGALATDVAATALPFVAGKVLPEVPEVLSGGWRKIGNPFGLASTGEELLTQGISPRTSLLGFKPALQKAAGDLKAYDTQFGINNVQDLSDAIPEIKQKIWSEEVEPALKRQAAKPVDMKPVASAVRDQVSPEMEEFDEANAEKLQKLATKLDSTRDVQSANRLLKYVNGQLESYFQKFPAARKANLMNNPETAGWEAARAELRNQFLSTMESAGETSIRDARLRYGALDTLQDAVERRVNVADRAKPMSLGRIVGLAAALPTGGTSIALGELSNYLNKPDVLVRRGIQNLATPEALQGRPTLFPQPAARLLNLTTLAGISNASQRQAANQ